VVEIFVIVSGTGWLFLTVTGFEALVVFTVTLPIAKLAGDTTTGANPVPLNVAVCGLFDALSVTVSVPLNAPVVAGLNDTVIVQFALGARACGEIGHVDVSEKLPVVVILVIVRGVAALVSVILADVEKPTASDPKLLFVGLRVCACNQAPQQERIVRASSHPECQTRKAELTRPVTFSTVMAQHLDLVASSEDARALRISKNETRLHFEVFPCTSARGSSS
jgi:hypothetical protein